MTTRIRIAVAVALLPAWAHAQQTPQPPAGGASAPAALPEIRVQSTAEQETATGSVQGYRARRSATATKTDTPLAETPQSVTVITRERIEDQGATGLQDALNYAAGVRSDAYGIDSRTDSVFVRGAYPAEYLDGLRQRFNFYTSGARVDPYLLERIEVLRGPAAMLFGQGSTAGVVNMVSKRPLADAQHEVGVQIGSFERRQVQADLTGPLAADGRWLYRLVALARKSDTQTDFVPDDRLLVAPTLTWRPSDATSLTLQGLVQRDRSGSTAQFFPWQGTVLPNPNGQIPIDRFIGEPGYDRYDTDRETLGWLFEHRFNDNWSVRQNLRVIRNEVEYPTFYSDAFSNAGNSFIDADQRMLDRFGYGEVRNARMLALDQHLEGRLATGALRHHLLAGIDAVRFRERSKSYFDLPVSQGGTVQPIDVYAPVYAGYTPPPFADGAPSSQRQLGVYLQDQMKLGAHWIVVAGVRHDRVTNGLEGSEDEKSRATSRRLGLMYAFASGASPYLSYSESFNPLAGTNVAGARFRPVRGEQIEAGVKFEPSGGGYTFTAAVYELRENSRLAADPANPLNQIQVGNTETTGAELELLGRVGSRLELSAHYNYLDQDALLDGVPSHQSALWAKYRFAIGGAGGFAAGLGVRNFNAHRDGIAPTTPSVLLVDALLAWNSARWRYALNVQNLGDKIYLATCLGRGDCFFGARRTLTATATYRF